MLPIVSGITARELRARNPVNGAFTIRIAPEHIHTEFAAATFSSAPGMPVQAQVPGEDESISREEAQVLGKRFAEALETAAKTKGNARQRGRAVGQAYIRFALENPDTYRLMYDPMQPDPARFPDLARAQARSRRTMSAYVEDLVAEGELHVRLGLGQAIEHDHVVPGGRTAHRDARRCGNRGSGMRHPNSQPVPRSRGDDPHVPMLRPRQRPRGRTRYSSR